MGMEIVTTPDREKRNQMFQELRASTITVKKEVKGKLVDVVVPHPTESQVVKFSGVEMVAAPAVDNTTTPPTTHRAQYRSTWSIAYPAS